MRVKVPRVVAEHHQGGEEILSFDGDALRVLPEVEVRVECRIDDIPAALTALDRAMADVRKQLRHLARVDERVIVDGPDAQDRKGGASE